MLARVLHERRVSAQCPVGKSFRLDNWRGDGVGGNGQSSVFGEWDYMNFGTRNLTFTDPNLGSTQVSVKQQINVLKLGINYRFGNSLPQQYP